MTKRRRTRWPVVMSVRSLAVLVGSPFFYTALGSISVLCPLALTLLGVARPVMPLFS